jgi:Ni/Co efflux regulator RcnB
MSVPLDRLYNHLTDCVNHDLLIYRWSPHGSKKIEDLLPLFNYSEHEYFTRPIMICHDQEPLDVKLYNQKQIRTTAESFLSEYAPNWHLQESVLDFVSALHLRSVTFFHSVWNNVTHHRTQETIACNSDYDLAILLHSEQRSKQVTYFSKKHYVPVYYWSHAVIALDWYRYAEHDPNLDLHTNAIDQDFLIYNRAWSGTREYRLKFIENLIDNKLLEHCKTKFCPVDQDTHYTNHVFVNQKFKISNTQLENYFPPNSHQSASSADYVANDYVTTGIEVVLETLFDDDRWHLTEKTLRPIACGKPFMLAATAGSLQYLRNYGFETFHGLIDESYDAISDSCERLNAVVQEMKRISALDSNTKHTLYTKLHEISKRNQQRFFNGLFDQVIQEYTTNLDHAMSVINQHCTGQHIAALQKVLQQNWIGIDEKKLTN